MNESISIEFSAKIKPVKPINDELTLCKCYVLALGKNRNRSVIKEPAVKDALPTLFNIPVVGHIYADADGEFHMGGHDVKLEKDEKGKYKFRALTVPYGMVPEQNDIRYEEVEGKDGVKRIYLVTDVILWTGRYPELKETIYDADVYFGQSMEIKVKGVARNSEDKSLVDITKFTFSALCLLGKSDDESYDHEPCFPDASVVPYKFEIGDDYTLLFEEFKKELALCFSNQQVSEKGGKEELEDKEDKTPLGERQPATQVDDAAALPASVETPAAEAADANFKAVVEATPAAEEETYTFAASYTQKRDALFTALCGMRKAGKESMTEYWLSDFDDKFVYVERMCATRQGSECTKGRMTYEVGADGKAIVTELSFETMLVKWLTLDESAALDAQREEHAKLTAYKLEQEASEFKRKCADAIGEFPELHDDADFKALTKDVMCFESDEVLREKLFALRGKKFAPEAGKTEAARIPVGLEPHEESPYGGFFDRYLKK